MLDRDVSDRYAAGPLPGDVTVVQSSTASDNWRLDVGGRVADHGSADGWADSFAVGSGGRGTLGYHTPLGVRLLVGGQVVLWLAVVALALRMRFGPGDPPPRRRERRRPRRRSPATDDVSPVDPDEPEAQVAPAEPEPSVAPGVPGAPEAEPTVDPEPAEPAPEPSEPGPDPEPNRRPEPVHASTSDG